MPKYSKFLNKENKNTISYLLDHHKHVAAKTRKERNRNPLNEKAMNRKSQFVALLVLGWSIADCACLVISHKSYGHLPPYFLLPPSIWFLLQYTLACSLKTPRNMCTLLDSLAGSLFENFWLSWQIIPDDKIRISLLILRRGALSAQSRCSIQQR